MFNFHGYILRVSLDTKSRVRKIANANYIMELCSTLKLTLVNIGPLDIVDCNKKLLLALVWQLTKRYVRTTHTFIGPWIVSSQLLPFLSMDSSSVNVKTLPPPFFMKLFDV
jgi:hypothetical protein